MITPRLITNNQSSNFKQFSNNPKNNHQIIDYWNLIIGYFKQAFCLIIVYWLLIITFSTQARAESLSVSLRVGDTRVEFAGFTSPSAFIVIKQNDVVVSTTVADTNGDFDQTIEAYNPGLQSFTLHATDVNGLLTPTLNYDINLTANTLTVISNIVFPPTIKLDTSTSLLSGLSHPLSNITLVLSTSASYPLTVDPNGTWSFDLNTLPEGDYTAYVIASMPGSMLSLESTTISFSIAGTSSSASRSEAEIPSVDLSKPKDEVGQSPSSRHVISHPRSEAEIPSVDLSSPKVEVGPVLFVTIAQPVFSLSIIALIAFIFTVVHQKFKKKIRRP